jgi:molybdopterin converting factor small subunit
VATVFIPSLLQSAAGGAASVELDGATVGELVSALEARFPALAGRIAAVGALRPNLAVAIDGEVTPLGLRARTGPDSEVHFVAAIKGGRGHVVHS